MKVPLLTRRRTYIQGGRDGPPRVLHKAMVITSGQRWTCLSHGPVEHPSSSLQANNTSPTLTDSINNLPRAAQWSVKNFNSSDNGEHIAQAIQEETAVAVCDGLYKEGKGSSAWVLEGSSAFGRITGYNLPPGISTGQNSYRSELAGLYRVITMISTICSQYHLTSGKITIACDNFSALFNSMEDYKNPKISDAEYDLIYAIKNQIAPLPISHQTHHVKGHQDEVLPTTGLDRWSLLNIEMDRLAKSVVTSWTENLSHQEIEGEPWSVWINEIKLVNELEAKLYEIMYSKTAEEYWIRKEKFSASQATNIHWEAIGKAMKELSLARRTFMTKHVTGLSGVGKFMKIWGERDTDACPRCGAPENAAHVWTCPHPQATDVWNDSMKKLEDWMIEVGTLPDIRDSILYHLKRWRSPEEDNRRYNNTNSNYIDLQGECGWQSMLEGFVTKAWAETQHSYYSMIQAPRTGKRWIIELIKNGQWLGTNGNTVMRCCMKGKT
jgi:hypothetical protein